MHRALTPRRRDRRPRLAQPPGRLRPRPHNTKETKIIGEGAHHYDNRDHAEIVALKQAAARGIATHGATAYVTLEPCSHHGRTGPCADALIAAGIARCVIATLDPNPKVSGQGIEQTPRRRHRSHPRRPASKKPATSTTPSPSSSSTTRPSSPSKPRSPSTANWPRRPPRASPTSPTGSPAPPPAHEVQQLRHASDAILTGIGTVLADDPALTDRSAYRPSPAPPPPPPSRRPRHPPPHPARLAARPLRQQRSPHPLRFPRALRKNRRPRCAWRRSRRISPTTPAASASPPSSPHSPSATSSASSSNAGSHLNGAFLRQSLVDKAVLFYAETELGDQAIPFAKASPRPISSNRPSTASPAQLRPGRLRHRLPPRPLADRLTIDTA